jgi:hypothetical protein
MEMQSCLTELKSITDEIKKRAAELKKLTSRKNELLKNAEDFMEKTDKNGLKYKDITLISEEKIGHIRKKKSTQIQACKDALKNYGIQPNEKMISEVMKAMKGDEIKRKNIKIIKNK